MPIPFLDLFTKAKARFGKPAPAPRAVVPRAPIPEKSAAERLSKTVMPNTTRTVAPADPFKVAAGSAKGRTRDTPTPLTPEPEMGERVITLTLADVLDAVPQSSIKSRDSLDPNRPISLKCGEVEKGMATGQPTVLLLSIYEQAPDIFRQEITAGDLTEVSLPLAKVLEQFQALQVRGDQMEDEAVPQLDTPFLQVTIEDTKKFGTSLAPLQTSAAPPVKMEPATARSLSKAEPEPVAQEKFNRENTARRSTAATPKSPSKSKAKSPAPGGATRIPFKLPPNGAGVPVSERVPASSGPPVPNPPSAPPKSATPARIPFKLTPPSADLKPKLTLVPGVDPVEPNEALQVTEPIQ